MLESTVVKKIRRYLKHDYPNCFEFKSHGGKYQSVGLPDIICCINGKFVGIEVKAPGKENTLTAIQQHTIELIRQAGGIAFMASSPEDTKQ